jgi:uncharacterized membrane protein
MCRGCTTAVVFWGGLIAVVVWAIRGDAASGRVPRAAPGQTSASQILDRRLADGSIDVEEYERRRRLLDDAGHDRRDEPRERVSAKPRP